MNQEIPHEFLCPITLSLMENPVTNIHGHTFDRDAIMSWYVAGSRKNPLTNMNLPTLDLTPNRQLKAQIDGYRRRIEKEEKREEEGWKGMVEIENDQIEDDVGKERPIRKLLGTVEERMEMKKKEIAVYKHNFAIWKKEFDRYMNEHENIVTVLGNKAYVGEIKAGRRHGKGICYYRDGSKYAGEWLHDYYYGKGTFHTETDKVQYGEWKLGDLQGLGMYEDDAGFLYEGDLKHGTQSGWGVVYKENKVYFEGEWKFGLRHGKGIRYMEDGKFEGLWRYGVRHGAGTLMRKDGKAVKQKWFHGEVNRQDSESIQ